MKGKEAYRMAPHYCPSYLLREYGSFWAHPPRLKRSRQGGKAQGESLPGVLVFWVLTSPAGSAAPWCLYTLVSMWMCHLGRGTDHMVCHHLTVEHRFLLFSTIGILSQVMWWGLSCACQDIQQRLTGLYRLDAHSIPILITKNCFWTLPNVPLEDRITPRWE